MLGEPQIQLGCLIVTGLATTLTLLLLRSRRGKFKQEKTKSTEDDFEEINTHLQTELNNKITERIEEVRREISARKLDLDNSLRDLLCQQEAEVLAKKSEFEILRHSYLF